VAALALSAASLAIEWPLTRIDRHTVSPAVLLILLVAARRHFAQGSGIPSLKLEGLRVGVAALASYVYGALGFWLLDEIEFRHNFHWAEALRQAALFLSSVGDDGVLPHTAYARWFLGSLHTLYLALLAYAGWALFRPAVYFFQQRGQELQRAESLVARYGRSAQDYFKIWPDKSFFFHPSGEAFLAYRVGRGVAVVLGDPVGPPELIGDTIRRLEDFCRKKGWRVAFHQVLPESLPVYESLGYRHLKVGDEAIVDAGEFSLVGSARKQLRNTVAKLERQGVRAEWVEAPLSPTILEEAREVSQEWLAQPGNRERQFTLGWFRVEALREAQLLVARDKDGRMVAFLNPVESYRDGEISVDLMRRRADAPNGVIDFLFVKFIQQAHRLGYERVNLGMAPMAGFFPGEESRRLERAVHRFFQNYTSGFRFRGLKEWKSKFATEWEPRYAAYRNALDLPALGLALARVSEMPQERRTR
jgi:phosphatidylglycerol lysyltransferase